MISASVTTTRTAWEPKMFARFPTDKKLPGSMAEKIAMTIAQAMRIPNRSMSDLVAPPRVTERDSCSGGPPFSAAAVLKVELLTVRPPVGDTDTFTSDQCLIDVLADEGPYQPPAAEDQNAMAYIGQLRVVGAA